MVSLTAEKVDRGRVVGYQRTRLRLRDIPGRLWQLRRDGWYAHLGSGWKN